MTRELLKTILWILLSSSMLLAGIVIFIYVAREEAKAKRDKIVKDNNE